MAYGQENGKIQGENEISPQEADRLARVRRSNRMWYERNKHWILEERRQKRAVERKRRKRRRPKPEPKPKPPKLTPEEIAHRRELRRAKAQKLKEEWNELGWVVAKMNIEAKISQEDIYALLGGMASKNKIKEWCAKGKKLSRLKPKS